MWVTAMLEVKLKRNPAWVEGIEGVPRYFFEIDLGSMARERRRALVPVYWRPARSIHVLLKEIYSADIAGIGIEKGNLQALAQSVKDALLSLVRANSLPCYFLSWPSGGAMVPSYRQDKALHVRLGEVQFKASNIGQLRTRLAEYLIRTRKIKQPDELMVYLLSPGDLQIRPPDSVLFYPEASEIWLPVFYQEGERGKVLAVDLGALADGLPELEAAQDIFQLRQQVAESLFSAGKINDRLELRIGCIGAETWRGWQRLLVAKSLVLTYYADQARGLGGKVQIPIYANENEYIAAHKEGSDRYALCFGRDEQDLRRRVAEELTRSGIIPSADWLTIESATKRG